MTASRQTQLATLAIAAAVCLVTACAALLPRHPYPGLVRDLAAQPTIPDPTLGTARRTLDEFQYIEIGATDVARQTQTKEPN